MDNLTHTLIGVGLARAGLARTFGRGATLALALGSNLPDVDVLGYLWWGRDAIFHRRMATHSLVTLPLLALAASALLRRPCRELSFARRTALLLLGALLHVAFDLLNSFGVVALYPLRDTRYELAWVFIIDLCLWALLLAPFALERLPRLRSRAERVWRVALAGVALYVAGCGLARARAAEILDERLAADGAAPAFVYLFPEPLGPHRFRGVAREGASYRVYLVHVLAGRVEALESVPTEEGDPLVAAARATPRGRQLEWFYKAPVWHAAPDEHCAFAFDLRFRSAVLGFRRDSFGRRVDVPGAGAAPAESPAR